jgi:hypothetical protein
MLAWLATTPLSWRRGVHHVAIDMSTTYRAAIRTGLPHTIVVVDHFRVVHLARSQGPSGRVHGDAPGGPTNPEEDSRSVSQSVDQIYRQRHREHHHCQSLCPRERSKFSRSLWATVTWDATGG